MTKKRCARTNSERGAALLEVALTLPLLLLVAVGIFEFGRAYQTWQVLTNAAREGARLRSCQASMTMRWKSESSSTWRPDWSRTLTRRT